MTDKFIKRLLISVTIFLFALTIGSIVLQFYKDKFDVFMSIYVVSTFAIAILTICYVLTTHNQFNVMKEQLREMKVSRELESQPLPVLVLSEISLEKPRAFYSPPEKEYSAQSRYFVPFNVENKGKYPAVNIDCTGYLHIKSEEKPITFTTVSEHFPVLAEDGISKSESFMFPLDRQANFISSVLYDKVSDLPVLVVYTIFRNIIGGAFRHVQAYRVMPNNNVEETLKNWLTTINSFQLQYKKELDKINKLPIQDEKRHELFEFLKTDFASHILGDTLKLKMVPLPGSYDIKYLTNEEYKKAKKDIGYGTVIPIDLEDCIHED